MNTYVKHLNRKKLWYVSFFISVTILSFFIYNEIQSSISPVSLVKGNPNEKQIALTFNISWGDEKVHDILNVLTKEKVHATFFVSGEWAERHPQIINEITEHGHELAMLGYRYKNYLEQELNQVRKDIIYAKEVFRKLGYKDIAYIRPPSGLFNEDVINEIEKLGLKAIHWSINTNDWQNPGVENIVNSAKEASNGDIILMHASDSAKQTAEALEQIIPHFKKDGYGFITISELDNDIKMETKLIE